MNDETRAELMEELTQAQHDAWPGLDADFIVNTEAIMPIIDRSLTDEFQKGYSQRLADEKKYADRAATVAEPDAGTVERVAKAIFGEPDGCDNRPEMWGFLDEGWRESCRNQARAAIAAMPSGKDDNWLDEALDSVPGMSLDKLYDGNKGPSSPPWYKEPLPEERWTARVIVRQGQAGDAGYWVTHYIGTGTTRREAILDAVAKAKKGASSE